jgi:hypothetical protein
MLALCIGEPVRGEAFLVKDWGQMTLPEIWVAQRTVTKRRIGYQFDVYRAAMWETNWADETIDIRGPLTACPTTVTQQLWKALRNQGSVIYLGDIGKISVP